MSPSALAEAAGVSSTTLTRPLNNPHHKFEVSLRTLKLIERATGVPMGPFFGESGQTGAVGRPVAANGDALVPIFDVEASAGSGAVIDHESIVDTLAFPRGYLQQITSTPPSKLAIISVRGDSMEPTLGDKDVVMIDLTKKNLGFDGLFVIRVDSVLHVKRILRGARAGYVQIVSDKRSEYPAYERSISEIEVIGKVVWYGRKV